MEAPAAAAMSVTSRMGAMALGMGSRVLAPFPRPPARAASATDVELDDGGHGSRSWREVAPLVLSATRRWHWLVIRACHLLVTVSVTLVVRLRLPFVPVIVRG